MVTKVLDGKLYKEMILNAASYLKQNAEIVNDLNVFPVPDGDTGDNMQMTIQGGANAVNNSDEESISQVARKVANGMFMGARGNSGVILSQFFEGVSKGLKDYETVDAQTFAKALKAGVKQAYGAVINPVEGTILTVMNDASNYTEENVDNDTTINKLFELFILEMYRSLERTPTLLPVLKEAGVVDSGGAGFTYIVDGMMKTLKGEKIERVEETATVNKTTTTGSFNANSELVFGYCTEFLLQLQNSKVDTESFDIKIIIDYLKTIGDSIVAFKNGDIVKVHVHTKTPGKVIDFVQKFGEFLTFKLENMSLQHSEATIENRFETKKEVKRVHHAVVSVATGDGIIETFKNLGSDAIVKGGQTMNPSIEDFMNVFDSLNADNIYVLPNNKNIVLTAQKAAEHYDKAAVHVINTTSLAQGYAALTMLDLTSDDKDQIIQNFNDAIEYALEGEVTYAVRDVTIDNVEIHKDDFMALSNKRIISSCASKVEACKNLIDDLDADHEYEVVTVFYGKDVSEEEKNEVISHIKANHPNLEVGEISSKHEVYSFILVL